MRLVMCNYSEVASDVFLYSYLIPLKHHITSLYQKYVKYLYVYLVIFNVWLVVISCCENAESPLSSTSFCEVLFNSFKRSARLSNVYSLTVTAF